MRDLMAKIATDHIAAQNAEIDRLVTNFRVQHGRWPRFAWVSAPGVTMAIEPALVGCGDAMPPKGRAWTVYDVDQLNRTEIDE